MRLPYVLVFIAKRLACEIDKWNIFFQLEQQIMDSVPQDTQEKNINSVLNICNFL